MADIHACMNEYTDADMHGNVFTASIRAGEQSSIRAVQAVLMQLKGVLRVLLHHA